MNEHEARISPVVLGFFWLFHLAAVGLLILAFWAVLDVYVPKIF